MICSDCPEEVCKIYGCGLCHTEGCDAEQLCKPEICTCREGFGEDHPMEDHRFDHDW